MGVNGAGSRLSPAAMMRGSRTSFRMYQQELEYSREAGELVGSVCKGPDSQSNNAPLQFIPWPFLPCLIHPYRWAENLSILHIGQASVHRASMEKNKKKKAETVMLDRGWGDGRRVSARVRWEEWLMSFV